MNFVSERQREIWTLIARGGSTKQIASTLGICRGTVDKHAI